MSIDCTIQRKKIKKNSYILQTVTQSDVTTIKSNFHLFHSILKALKTSTCDIIHFL